MVRSIAMCCAQARLQMVKQPYHSVHCSLSRFYTPPFSVSTFVAYSSWPMHCLAPLTASYTKTNVETLYTLVWLHAGISYVRTYVRMLFRNPTSNKRACLDKRYNRTRSCPPILEILAVWTTEGCQQHLTTYVEVYTTTRIFPRQFATCPYME